MWRSTWVLLLSALCLHATAFSVQAGDVNFVWAKTMGSLNATATTMGVDSSGNVYTFGLLYGTSDFDPGPGVYNLTPEPGYKNIFICKLDSNGNFVWARKKSAIAYDEWWGFGAAVDSTGNVYITGPFFIAKFNSSGNLAWEQALPYQEGWGIAVDTSGNVYTTGMFFGTVDFDPGPGTYNLTAAAGVVNIFIRKQDNSGNFVWAKSTTGGSYIAYDVPYYLPQQIDVDSSGNVYTTGGFFNTVDFDPGPGSYNLTNSGMGSYILKLDSSGSFVWAKSIGSASAYSAPDDLTIDSSGNVYTTGGFNNTVDFDPGPGVYNLTSTDGTFDIFINKLDSNGNFLWAKAMGGAGLDYSQGIAVDSSGGVFTAGYFRDTVDFDPGSEEYSLTSTGEDDIFINKLDSSGNFIWSKAIGGTGYDSASGVAVTPSGVVYASGSFEGTVDFDPGLGIFNMTSNGIYVLSLQDKIDFPWSSFLPIIIRPGIIPEK